MTDQALPDVTAEATTSDGTPCVLVKIGTPQVEINVWIPETEVAKLSDVRAVKWLSKSLRLGDVAGAPAWWSADMEAETLAILVGQDDETWDVGVTVPLGTLDAIIAEVAGCRAPGDGR